MKLFLANCSKLPEDAGTQLLAPADLPDVDRLSRSGDRARQIKLRNLRRKILAQHLRVSPQELDFVDEIGKPALQGRSDIHFSTSSSGDFFAIAISDQPIGVDLEVVDQQSQPEDLNLTEYLFHANERQALSELSAQEWQKAFYLIWTQKEAYSKARALGFGLEFDSFAVTISGGMVLEGKDDPSPAGWHTFPITNCWPLVLAVAQAGPLSVGEPTWFDWPLSG